MYIIWNCQTHPFAFSLLEFRVFQVSLIWRPDIRWDSTLHIFRIWIQIFPWITISLKWESNEFQIRPTYRINERQQNSSISAIFSLQYCYKTYLICYPTLAGVNFHVFLQVDRSPVLDSGYWLGYVLDTASDYIFMIPS